MSNSLFNFHFLYQNIRHKVRTCQAFYSLFFSLPPGPGWQLSQGLPCCRFFQRIIHYILYFTYKTTL